MIPINAIDIHNAQVIYGNALAQTIRHEYELSIWYKPEEYRHPAVQYFIEAVGNNGYKYVVRYTCWEFDPNALPPGITQSGVDRFQYSRNRNIFGRPRAYRMTFVAQPEFQDPNLTVSHLCHNPKCHNPAHIVLEPLEVNKGRNGCPGGPFCRHQRNHCMIPGPWSDY